MTQAIDPEILAARARQAEAFPGLDVTKLPPAEARHLANQAAAMFNDGGPEMARVETFFVGDIRTRYYEPHGRKGAGAIFYIHGGGWFSCNVDTHDRMLRCLALDAHVPVISVDYRLSPEHVFPAALNDCVVVWCWVQDNAARYGIDPKKIAISGDSAGANLALAVTLHERDEGRQMPACGALLYGCYEPDLDTASSRTYNQGYGLTTERMKWYWNNYLGPAKDSPPLLATPSRADMTGLPPQFLGYAQCDTLADESPMLAAKLRAAGVEVVLKEWPNTVHGFLQMTAVVKAARQAVTDTAQALAKWLK
jgi:acetyl esterase